VKVKNLSFFDGAIQATQNINMQTPYPEWAFFKSDTIKKNFIPQLEDMTKDYYENIFNPSLFAKCIFWPILITHSGLS